MKRLMTWLLALTMALSVTACGSKSAPQTGVSASASSAQSAESEAQSAADASETEDASSAEAAASSEVSASASDETPVSPELEDAAEGAIAVDEVDLEPGGGETAPVLGAELELNPADEAIEIAEVDAAEAFGGCYEFVAGKTGTYSFGCQYNGTFDYASIEYEPDEITWSVYVLDEEFNDAPRYLKQAYTPVLTDDGEVEIQEGQYVYCFCSMNAWTASEEVPGICSLFIYLQR